MNKLDRAIKAMQRSQAAFPELCRELRSGDIWFLVPFHPEVEGEVLELQNGSPLPFASIQDQAGEVVPVFTSEARLEEGLRNGRVPERTYSSGTLPAVQLLEILGHAGLRAVVNKGCATGEVTLPADLMRDLADGSALEPGPDAGRKQARLNILNPADYPTHVIQPAFEFMRRHGNFRAAWVFDGAACMEVPVPGRAFQLLFLMSPRDRTLVHDLGLIVQSACAKPDKVDLGFIDETDAAYIAGVFRQAPPFYVAADYRPPTGATPGDRGD